MHRQTVLLHPAQCACYDSPLVEQTVRATARFMLTVLGALVIIGLLGLVRRYVIGYAPDGATIDAGAALLDSLRGAVLPAVGVSLILALFDVLRVTERPLVPLLSLWIVAGGLAIAAGVLLDLAPADEYRTAAISTDRVIAYDDLTLYTAGREGLQIGPGVVYDPSREPGMRTFREAVILPETDELRIPRSDSTFALGRPRNGYSAMVDTPEGIAPILREVRIVTSVLMRGSGASIALTALVALYFVSCWTLIRLTRWPAFNAVLAIGAVRALLWTVTAIEDGPLTALVSTIMSDAGLWAGQMVAVAAYAAILILVGILLPPVRDWKREVE